MMFRTPPSVIFPATAGRFPCRGFRHLAHGHDGSRTSRMFGQSGPKMNWTGCAKERRMLAGDDLTGSVFTRAALGASDFAGSIMPGVKLNEAEVTRTRFEGANLSQADFTKTVGWRANFAKANLAKASSAAPI